MTLKHLAAYATPVQLQYLKAIEEHGSQRKAAKALNLHPSSIDRAIQRLKVAAAKQGYSPEHDMVHTVPDGFLVKGVSTYYDQDGKPRGQWVKSSVDLDRQAELIREAAQAMAEELPRLKPVPKPGHTLDHLCNVFTLTDCHVGMLAWHREGGSDWDLEIAEKTLVGCFEQMMASSPLASTCVIAQLGDYLHYDSALAAETPMHGHSLDADGRMPKMVRVAIRILRRVVDMALHRHKKVVLLLAEGNHDISSSVWLRAMFAALYENEPRIQVIDSELPYYVYEHGATLLAWHHGHLKKNDELPLLFAAQFPQAWGNTRKRYCHTGHRHHFHEKEHSGMTVIQHPTLASRDAYAARSGWIAERAATAMTYHRTHGQVSRVTVTPEMLEAA